MADRPGSALVTGASAGIGCALARVFAAAGHDLVLVARREGILDELAAELEAAAGVTVRVKALDLARPESPAELSRWTREEGVRVECLVNNAGFGLLGDFAGLDRERQLEMVRLNVLTLTDLTHRYLEEMLERGRGRILNVASTAAFQAGPAMAVYYATKAYVLHFSEALAEETRGTGVTVTTLCPGPTESEFHDRAGIAPGSPLHRFRASVEPVARRGYRGMMRGKAIVVPGFANRMGTLLVRLVPRLVVRRAVGAIQRKLRA
jgi:short-subunit dehydrogenase